MTRHIRDKHTIDANSTEHLLITEETHDALEATGDITGSASNVVPHQQLGAHIEGAVNNHALTAHHYTTTLESGFFPVHHTDLSFGDWLALENFGGAIQSWPFVQYDSEVRPTDDTTVCSRQTFAVDLQDRWYTHVGDEPQTQSGVVTPVARQNEIDEEYHRSLHRRLQVRSLDQSLPSVEYMNLCVKSYFKKFHHVFPILHPPTFRPKKSNAVLLLSLCSVGSLLTGHPKAYHHGVQLFERLHKAILAHWGVLMRRSAEECLAVIQASLIGQTFALLSGQAKHLHIFDAFHGTIISFARRAKIFHARHDLSNSQQEIDKRWKDWVHTEEKIRVALGLRIHDAEGASLLHHETILPTGSRLSQASEEATFLAQSSEEWFNLYNQQLHPALPDTPLTSGSSPGSVFTEKTYQYYLSMSTHSPFNIYAVLQDICSTIVEGKVNQSFTKDNFDTMQQFLIEYHMCYMRDMVGSETLHFGCKILWHYIFILLHSDLDLLEKGIGRDGPNLNPEDLSELQVWANSAAAKRCTAHAIMIKRISESIPLTCEPPINLPKALFSSAICLFSYLKNSDQHRHRGFSTISDFPEFHHLNDPILESLAREPRVGPLVDVDMGSLYGIVDLLNRIGHWENSRTFASILNFLLRDQPD